MQKKWKTAGERIDEATGKIQEAASKFGEKIGNGAEETKKVANNLKNWRERASVEEIVMTLIGIVLLILALIQLREFLWGIILLLAGLLCVMGYFNPFLRSLIDRFFSESEDTSKKDAHSKKED